MTTPQFKNLMSCALAILTLGAWTQTSSAQSSAWTSDSDGNWSDAAKWAGGVVADGAGNTADFSSVDITGNRTVTLDSPRTISGLVFGDAAPNFNWTLGGPNALTLGTTPLINVSNQSATISLVVTSSVGLTKIGNGTLNFQGTNIFSGTTSIVLFSNGVVNFNGAAKSAGAKFFHVGGAGGRAVLNLNTTSSITNNAASSAYYGIGGFQPDNFDTGVGVINISAGALNNGNNNDYTEIGTGATNGNALGAVSYGCINLQPGGAFNTLGSSGIRVGAGGIGVFNQTGGTLNCSRWFAVGSQQGNGANNVNAGGYGLVNFLGGTATIATGNRIILSDKNGSVGVLNIGSAAGGNATVAALNSSATQGAIDFMDQGGTAGKAIFNLNSGTFRVAGPLYRNNTGGAAMFNWNGGTIQFNANNMNFAVTNNIFPAISVFNGGAVIDTQGNTVNSAVQFLKPAGNGIYPAGGTITVPSGGGSGYLGQPVVTISGGSGSNAMAIANITGGVVTSVTMTSPGQSYVAGDNLSFNFAGGGALTPASTFNYTLQAGDVAANTNGGLTKFGSGRLNLTGVSTYSGQTTVAAGTLDVKVDGGIGTGNVSVAGGATLILETGATNGYIAATANLVVASTGLVNLNYSGANDINGLSLDGGATYVAAGTWGSSSSGAANVDDTHFSGTGVLNVLTTPAVTLTVALQSSVNPSVYGQSVTFTATVTSTGGGTPSGTVTFKDGATTIGTGTLNGLGIATFTTNGLATGSHPMTAVYTSVTSQILVQTVNIPTDLWTGSSSGAWDIGISSNWTVLGSPAVYQEANFVQMDDSAPGTTTVALNTFVNPANVYFSNASKAYVISGTGGIAGATALTKVGAAPLTLNVTNSYTGTTTLSNGVITFGPASASSGNGSFLVGGNNGGAIVNIDTTNSLTFNGALGIGGGVNNTGDTGAGAVNQHAGTFISWGGGNAYIELGSGGPTAYGAYNLEGGTFNTVNNSGVRVGATGYGVYRQSGGTFNCARYFPIGTQSGVNNVGGIGEATFTGGTALFSSSFRIIVGDKPGATGILNVGTEAGGTATLVNLFNSGGNGGLELLDNVGANSAIVNLNSGTVQLGGAIFRPSGAVGTPALNLNGATLQAGANNINLITNVISVLSQNFTANLFSRGIVIDSQSNNCSITADMVATYGDGVYPAAGVLAVGSGGAGYVGAPLVNVSGGSGFGAMAVAFVTNGTVTGVAMTCPGQNYQAGDTLNFDFVSGGPSSAAPTFSYTLQAGDLKANADGGLTKVGAGSLTVAGANNSYSGATVVSNGTLVVGGNLIGGGAVSVCGGKLGGTGVISGPVTVQNGGTLTAGINSIGTLTINSSLTFSNGSAFSAKIDKGSLTQDLVQGISQLHYAGSLLVTNLSGTVTNGDSFKLFDAASYSGSFSAVVPATPGAGLAWDTSELVTNGTLKVVVGSSVNPNPTNITFVASGGNLTLSWPADHIGWKLQTQTNALSIGLRTNWVDVANSTATNQMTFPLTATNACVFYRLAY